MRIDRPGLVLAALGAAAMPLPFMQFRANRIVAGEAMAMPVWAIATACVLLAIGAFRLPQVWRLGAAAVGIGLLIGLVGDMATGLDAPPAARASPGSGLWLLLGVFALLLADAIAKMRPGLRMQTAILILACAAMVIVLASGHLADVSVMREYAARSDIFASHARRHLLLAFGSLAAALAVGVPLGIWLHRERAARPSVMGTLNLVQTLPSLALFGMMIPLLSWVAASVPGAAALGIAGIGFAPALIALFLYSLLPVVGNTVVGLDGAAPEAREAGRGMGMTPWQVLSRVSIPLALPVIVAAVRIVLVQNIGLAVIAGLIGGGGFGTFVFQGLAQNAADLILLGAIPTVVMALVAGIALDLVVKALQR